MKLSMIFCSSLKKFGINNPTVFSVHSHFPFGPVLLSPCFSGVSPQSILLWYLIFWVTWQPTCPSKHICHREKYLLSYLNRKYSSKYLSPPSLRFWKNGNLNDVNSLKSLSIQYFWHPLTLYDSVLIYYNIYLAIYLATSFRRI